MQQNFICIQEEVILKKEFIGDLPNIDNNKVTQYCDDTQKRSELNYQSVI